MNPEDERRHLVDGPRSAEEPNGIGTTSVFALCRGDSATVLERCREVLEVVLEHQTGEWPADERWAELLPTWFVDVCAPEMSQDQAEEWRAWWQSLPPDQQAEAALNKPWSLGNWLAWFEPDDRPWYWWAAEIESPDRLRVDVEVDGWPTPLGALRWLLRAAGATSTQVEE